MAIAVTYFGQRFVTLERTSEALKAELLFIIIIIIITQTFP